MNIKGFFKFVTFVYRGKGKGKGKDKGKGKGKSVPLQA